MKVTSIPIIIGALGTFTKGMIPELVDLEIRGRAENIELLYSWDRPEYWEKSWRLKGSCCHSNLSERPSTNAEVKKKLSKNKIIVIYK